MAKIVSTGKTLASESFLEKRRRARRRRLVVFFAIILALVVGLIFLLRHDKLRIKEVKIVGNEVTNSAGIIAVAADSLSGYYFQLIPRDSTFFYPESEMEEMILYKFPRFSFIRTSLAGLETLEITVAEREPVALYCESLNATSCYFLDETGYIFDIAPSFSDGVYIVYTHATSLESPLRKEFLPRDEFWELDGFVRNLSNFGIKASALEVGEREITVIFAEEATLLLSRGDNMALVLSNLETFFSAPEIKNDEEFLDKVSKLDLRTDNKVFYTFREE